MNDTTLSSLLNCCTAVLCICNANVLFFDVLEFNQLYYWGISKRVHILLEVQLTYLGGTLSHKDHLGMLQMPRWKTLLQNCVHISHYHLVLYW
jgi:hypothetical protein